MQHLTETDTEALRKIIAVYREHREAMASMPVNPIGELPNGVNWSGFHWTKGQSGYLTLFRGITDKDTYTFDLPCAGRKYTLLHSNTDTSVQ